MQRQNSTLAVKTKVSNRNLASSKDKFIHINVLLTYIFIKKIIYNVPLDEMYKCSLNNSAISGTGDFYYDECWGESGSSALIIPTSLSGHFGSVLDPGSARISLTNRFNYRKTTEIHREKVSNNTRRYCGDKIRRKIS